MDIFWSPGENAFEFLLGNFNSARAPARAAIVPVRRRRESEGRDRQVFPSFSYNRCEPSHVGRQTLVRPLEPQVRPRCGLGHQKGPRGVQSEP